MDFKQKFDEELFKVSPNLYDSDTLDAARTLMELSTGRHEKELKKTKNNGRSYRVYIKCDVLPPYIPRKPRTPRVPTEFLEEKETKNGIEREKRPMEKVLSKDSKKRPRHEKKQKEEIGRKRVKLPSEEELKSRGVNLELPETIRDFVKEKEGTEPVMVIRKVVYDSDLKLNKGRFSMPLKQLAVSVDLDRRFLTEEERDKVVRGESVGVRFVEPEFFEVSVLKLKNWNMNKSKNWVLKSGWANVLRKYENKERYRGLKKGDTVQVWAFRCNQEKELWLALTVIDRAPEEAD